MWIEINQDSFAITQSGFVQHADGPNIIFTSPGLNTITHLRDLKEAEYGIALSIDTVNRNVAFGRDYLGHYPLLYAQSDDAIFISDDFNTITAWLEKKHIALTVSEESLALYFVMGYVPQGRTLYDQVTTCSNATLYHWQNGNVTSEDIFTPIDVDESIGISDLRDCLEQEMAKQASAHSDIDVWCSGGLDSCIISHLMNTNGRHANLLSLENDDYIKREYGEGEYQFARELADKLGLDLRSAVLTPEFFAQRYNDFIAQHLSPIVDLVVPPKYSLAYATNKIAMTGEGGDPLFSGVKNNAFLFSLHIHPKQDVGWLYSKVHGRLYKALDSLFTHGDELKGFVSEYFVKQFDKYPGDYTRKLFYMNTFGKQGGMIFPKNYYAGKTYGIKTLHPLTSLSMYKLAFSLRDDMKYNYPDGKLALIDAYKDELPDFVTTRKKSGTRLPLAYHVDNIAPNGLQPKVLSEFDYLDQAALSSLGQAQNPHTKDVLLQYGLITLDKWLSKSQGENNARTLSNTPCREQQRRATG